MSDHIYVHIPVRNLPQSIRRAVEAVLNQDYSDFTLIVTDDGSDPGQRPWDALADIDDPRLVRHQLPVNRGRYYADQVALHAAYEADPTSWYAPHDADDAARPDWLSSMLALARKKQASAVFCGHLLHGIHSKTPQPEHPRPFTGAFSHHAHLAGLWKTSFLADLGGMRPDFRIGYDSMITGVAMATGRCQIHHGILYDRYLRKGSLTKAPETRMGSPARKRARTWMERHWPAAVRAAKRSPRAVGEVLGRTVPEELKTEIRHHSQKLRKIMQNSHVLEEPYAWATSLNDSTLWGDWALNPATGALLARELEERRPKVIVEGGSGTTSTLFSQYADTHGARVVSLESSPVFRRKTLALLERFSTGTNVEVRDAPLYKTSDGPWYTADLPDDIDFALIDGPRQCDGGRRASLGALLPHLAPGAFVVLDDTDRELEQGYLRDWKKRYGVQYAPIGDGASRVFIPEVDAAHTGGAKLVITLLTGRRPELLENTLHRMQLCAPGLLRRAHVIVMHNSGDPETAAVLDKYADFIDDTVTTQNLLTIGEATSRLARLAHLTDRKYWLHLEDDWALLPTTPDWLAQAQTILHSRPNIFQVRLRHHTETTLDRHMVTSRPIRWAACAGYRMSVDAHYTANPSLLRTRDIAKIWPAEGEREAQRNAHRAGLRVVAQLMPGGFVHTGGDKSLREATKCPA